MKFDEMSLRKRQLMVGMARQLYDEGLTTKEVAAKMRISESTVRSIKNMIDQAKANGMK